jgi:hypothetical protein
MERKNIPGSCGDYTFHCLCLIFCADRARSITMTTMEAPMVLLASVCLTTIVFLPPFLCMFLWRRRSIWRREIEASAVPTLQTRDLDARNPLFWPGSSRSEGTIVRPPVRPDFMPGPSRSAHKADRPSKLNRNIQFLSTHPAFRRDNNFGLRATQRDRQSSARCFAAGDEWRARLPPRPPLKGRSSGVKSSRRTLSFPVSPVSRHFSLPTIREIEAGDSRLQRHPAARHRESV